MADNAQVRSCPTRFATVLLLVMFFWPGTSQARAHSVQTALAASLHGTQASAIVLDPQTGAVLASIGETGGGAPGSVTKPILLAYALQHGVVSADTTVYCRRNLRVGVLALPCTHPADQTLFTASSALAESCNTWFAEMARRFTGPQLEAALQAAHLPHRSMEAATVEQRQLAVLGLRGVNVSPLLLAQAYRQLLQQVPASGPVVQGLRDSVRFGMANGAAVPGMDVLGKTGTASNPHEAWTHGWFAGAVPGRFILVVYVPHGDGGTAARLANKFFVAMAAAERTSW